MQLSRLEHSIHNAGVGGSSPPISTKFFNDLPKNITEENHRELIQEKCKLKAGYPIYLLDIDGIVRYRDISGVQSTLFFLTSKSFDHGILHIYQKYRDKIRRVKFLRENGEAYNVDFQVQSVTCYIETDTKDNQYLYALFYSGYEHRMVKIDLKFFKILEEKIVTFSEIIDGLQSLRLFKRGDTMYICSNYTYFIVLFESKDGSHFIKSKINFSQKVEEYFSTHSYAQEPIDLGSDHVFLTFMLTGSTFYGVLVDFKSQEVIKQFRYEKLNKFGSMRYLYEAISYFWDQYQKVPSCLIASYINRLSDQKNGKTFQRIIFQKKLNSLEFLVYSYISGWGEIERQYFLFKFNNDKDVFSKVSKSLVNEEMDPNVVQRNENGEKFKFMKNGKITQGERVTNIGERVHVQYGKYQMVGRKKKRRRSLSRDVIYADMQEGGVKMEEVFIFQAKLINFV